MRIDRLMNPWLVIVIALLLAAAALIWGSRSLQVAEVGVSVLILLSGLAYALFMSHRTGKMLKQEIERKTAELQATNEQLRHALHDLEETSAFLRSAIEGMPLPLLVIDSDYRLKLMNQAARQLACNNGLSPQVRFCYQASHQQDVPCDQSGHPCPMEKVRQTGRTVRMEHEHFCPSGEWRYVEIIAAPLRGADGTFRGIVEVNRDITERKRIERSLARQVSGRSGGYDDLDRFSNQVARAIQDFFAHLPVEGEGELEPA